MIDNEAFEGRRAVRYLGQYKPTIPYALANGLVILPAGWDMVPYGPFSELRVNTCYIVGPNELSESDLKATYRQWLIFDAFILDDHCPILYFDEGRVGGVELVPAGVPQNPPCPDYRQIDYDNVAEVMLKVPSKLEAGSRTSYSDLFTTYSGLDERIKAMIEWSVSQPYRSHSRAGAFFNPNYWQLFHTMVLLEKLLGRTPTCSQDFGKCHVCGRKPPAHEPMTRREWFQQFLAKHINHEELVQEYARAIETGVLVRNGFAHNILFDSSTFPETPSGEPQEYGIDRAIAEYLGDSNALKALLLSLSRIARYILLNRAFGVDYFPRLPQLKSLRVSKLIV